MRYLQQPIGVALASAILLTAIHLLAVHGFSLQIWGAAAARYLPPACGWVLLALTLPLVFPPIARRVASLPARLWEEVLRPGARGRLARVLLPVAAFFLFVIFRSQDHFLGDGFLRIADLSRDQFPHRDAGVVDLALHQAIHRGLTAIGWSDPALAYWLPSCVAGAVAVALMPRLSERLIPDPGLRWTVPFFLLTLGSVQLYFGYVENYTLRELAVLAYVLLALRALAGGSVLPPTLLILAGCALHLTTLSLLPSLVPLFLARRGTGRKVILIAGTGIALTILLALVGLWALRSQYGWLNALLFIVPRGDQGYGLFSGAHFADLVNFLLLASPAAIPLLLIGLVSDRDAVRSVRLVSPRTAYWLLATLGPLAMIAVIDPRLGARDWDLAAMAWTPLTLLGLRVAFGRRGDPAEHGVAAVILGAVCILHTVPWILVNHNRDRSAEMVWSITRQDPHYCKGERPLYVNVATLLDDRGYHEHALDLLERAVAFAPTNPAVRYDLGTTLMRLHRLDEAARELERAVALDPKDSKGHGQLGAVYGLLGRNDAAEGELKQAVLLDPKNSNAHINLGVALARGGRMREAVGELEEALADSSSSTRLLTGLASAYGELGDWAKAREYASRAIELDGKDQNAVRIYDQAAAMMSDPGSERMMGGRPMRRGN